MYHSPPSIVETQVFLLVRLDAIGHSTPWESRDHLQHCIRWDTARCQGGDTLCPRLSKWMRLAVCRAVRSTCRSGHVGAVSALATHQSFVYFDAFAITVDLEVTTEPYPLFVEFIEAGTTGN